jgi:hypothetical protein
MNLLLDENMPRKILTSLRKEEDIDVTDMREEEEEDVDPSLSSG